MKISAASADTEVPAPIPVVGVGASAGGLEAFTQLLQKLSSDTGMSFVLVQHLDPNHESALTSLLSRATSMPVREVKDNTPVQPNTVYVIPPNVTMTISGSVLKLTSRRKNQAIHRPIDFFFESLAQDRGERAIGIVLSGTASDGTLGLEAIKAEGGITFAQDESAKYDSMPRSAIAAGVVDFVLSPQRIAEELARIASHPLVKNGDGQDATSSAHDTLDEAPFAGQSADLLTAAPAKSTDGYKKILQHLRNNNSVDFSLYKTTTIRRRIHRRMLLTKHDTLDSYASFLKGNSRELDALYSDVLISVTSFFRTPEAFDLLKHKIFPRILKDRGRDEPVRIWVLGCSTGQEAYSIAMAFTEYAEAVSRAPKLQIFATDLNEAVLDRARLGLYPKTLAGDISPQRLRKFFAEEEGGYRVSKALREEVVFARQNLLSDPPFSKMDLISCRNLLIYLEPEMQRKIIPALHYALRPNGFLFLGASESVGNFNDLFAPVDRKQKIFAKKAVPTPMFRLPLPEHLPPTLTGKRLTAPRPRGLPEAVQGEMNAQREADRLMVNQYAPPAVLVNSDLQVVQFRGATGAFLEPPKGKATFDILKMARQGLMAPLRRAINKARRDKAAVRTENVRVQHDTTTRIVNLNVIPLKNVKERGFLILFEPSSLRKGTALIPETPPVKPLSKREESIRLRALEAELVETRDYLQSIQEQHEAANEELQASNEEVQSANEELQSINEELETSKEELESTNEELTTVNEEMANRNAELSRLNSDLRNLQVSMNTPILLLGRDLTIRRFTPAAERVFDLLPTDIGRPMSGIRHNLDFEGIADLAREVIDMATVRDREVHSRDDHWYLLRMRPYMTSDNRIDGAMIVLVDIDAMKRVELEIKQAHDYAQAIIQHVGPLMILDRQLRVLNANESFYNHFKVTPAQLINRPIFELGNGQWDIPGFRKLLEDIHPRHSVFDDIEITHDFEGIGRRTVLVHGRQLEETQQIILRFEDVTERLHYQAEMRQSELRYRRLFESAQDGILLINPITRQITDANPYICQLLGYSREEFIGNELWRFGILADEQASHSAFRQLQDEGILRYESLPLQTKSGQLRQIEVVANLYREADRTALQWNIRDITGRKASDRGLAQQAGLLDLCTDALVARNLDNRITFWNHAAEDLYGWPRQEAIGMDFQKLLNTESELPFEELVAVLSRQHRLSGEITQMARDGRRVSAMCRWSLDRDAGGGPRAILTATTEIRGSD